MHPAAIPPLLARVLGRRPLLLAAAIAAGNRLRRLPRTRTVLVAVSIAALAALLVLSAAANGRAAAKVSLLLEHAGLVVAACALYAAALVARRRRELAAAAACSWLVATPGATHDRRAAVAAIATCAVLWRLLAAGAFAALLCADPAVTLEQASRLLAWVAGGVTLGAVLGAALPRSVERPRAAASRYTPRLRDRGALAPSAAALAHWPIAQAFAWSRPENTRWLLLTAILSVPIGAGALGGLTIVVTWFATSYLAALLAAVPRVAHAAAAWLRPTPATFLRFAWPIARRALAHQTIGACVAAAVLIAGGTRPSDAVELAGGWLVIVVLVAAISLADAYRARTSPTKIWLAILGTLLAEQRIRGLGLALALTVTAWHLRAGVTHERA